MGTQLSHIVSPPAAGLLPDLGLHLGFPGAQASHNFSCELPASSHVQRVNYRIRVVLGFVGPVPGSRKSSKNRTEPDFGNTTQTTEAGIS